MKIKIKRKRGSLVPGFLEPGTQELATKDRKQKYIFFNAIRLNKLEDFINAKVPPG